MKGSSGQDKWPDASRASSHRALKTLNSISGRAREIQPFLVMEVMERAMALEKEGRSVIHLEVGEPDFDTPEIIREAGIRAIRDGRTHYTHSLGLLELREAIVDWYRKRYRIEVSPENIVVSVGCSGAMLLTFAALLDPGARVLVTDPGYPCYPKFIRAFEGSPAFIPVREAEAFQYPLERVDAELDSKARALVLNSPSNPTGTLTTPERMAALARLSAGRATIVSDEIYHGLVYEERAHSILEFTSEAVVINGFSKLFAMTGWRLGYAILPEYLVRPAQKLQQNLLISAPDFAQYAAIAALNEAADEVEAMRQEYDRRRRFVLRRLSEIGLEPSAEPTGAFYVFFNVSRFTYRVYDFAFQILEEVGVAVTPGVDFGENGEGYLRICYANSMENLEDGMCRLERFFEGVPPVRHSIQN